MEKTSGKPSKKMFVSLVRHPAEVSGYK